MKNLVRAALIAAVLAAIVISGTAVAQSTSPSSSASATGSGKVTLNIGLDSDVTSLNPFNLCCGPDYAYLTYVYDTAFGYDGQLKAAPSIITSWTPSSDSMTWTLKIRDDATFNDGTPVTAEDVAFSFSFIVDNAMPFYKDYLPFNPTFAVVDPTTVLWKAEEPTFAPNVPAYIPIIPKHVWEKFVVPGDPSATKKAAKQFENSNPIGSGPFTLAEYQKDQFLRFEVRSDYWGGQPDAVQEIVLRIYSNQEAMTGALKSGEIDFADNLKPTLFNSLKGDQTITQHVADEGCWGNLAWNFGGQGPKSDPAPIIQDTTFRQAMATAIDKQKIIDKVYLGTSTAGSSILLPGVNGAWYKPIPNNLQFNYDSQTAMQMLDSIDVVDSNGDGIREDPNTGKNIDLNLLRITDVQGSVDTGLLLQGFFKDVGIDSHFTTVNTNKAGDLWYSGEWDAYIWDWCPDPDPDFMLSVFTTSQCLGWSDGCYSNPQYDKLYKLQQTQLNRADREATVNQMVDMIAEQLPTQPLANWSDLQAYRNDRFVGYLPSPDVKSGDLIFGWNHDSLFNLTVASNATTASSQGVPAWIWIVVVAAIAIIAFVVARTRRGKEEEEGV